ncbi:MAG: hypothetical protein QM784_17765 [Polyangiaceae bacterium]
MISFRLDGLSWAKLGRRRPIDWVANLGLAAVVVGAVFHACRYRNVVIDDSFITFRHAANLVHGNGFTCTPGQRVEGTSSPLFGLLLAFPIALEVDPYVVASWLSTAAFAGCVVIAYATVSTWLDGSGARWLGLGAAILVATSPILAFHSQTGLETLAYACTLACAWHLQLIALKRGEGTVGWARVMGVAALLRPEGFAFFLLMFGFGWLARIRQSAARATPRRELLAFGVIWVPWVLFRLAYFGTWLPNTVIAKSGHIPWSSGSFFTVLRDVILHGAGTSQLKGFVIENAVAMVLLLGAIALSRVRIPILFAIALTISYAAVTTWNGGDWMLHYRLLTPCIVPLAVGTVLGLRAFLFHTEQRGHQHFPSILISTAVLGVIVSGRSELPIDDGAIKDLPRIREVGQRLASIRREDNRVVSATAGILPYYWEAPSIDMFGLCDRHIAKNGKPLPFGLGRSAPDYLVAQRPTFYAFEYVGVAVEFFASREFAKERGKYALVQYPAQYLGAKNFNAPTLFVRKDRPELDRIERALGGKLVDAEQELRRLGFLDDSRLAR